MSFGESLTTLAADSQALVGFVIAAALVLVLTPLVARLAPLIGGLDDKADRPRVHRGAIPRIGGLAILAAILVPALVALDFDGPVAGILIGTVLVAALGLVDDIRGLTPSVKLLGVTLIALIPVLGYETTFDHVTLPVIGDHDLGWAAYPLTILWIALLANLVNLIDGMDG